ncbi:MAG TPA: hypothetical protein DDX84_08540 [Nitrospiraceae bacterium]|nr:MAG: hypothetical protein A3D21_07110 [Nitrospirae bacterium RIFCSPHIGHO2_02_FULL_42_12]HBI24229.1 hypothetical protein [Nitrospiraceae bacterium]
MALILLCSCIEHPFVNRMKSRRLNKETHTIDSGQGNKDADSFRILQILEEVAEGRPVTQRDLSKKLGIGLGMVNSYLKRLAQQGYIQIGHAGKRRLYYLLTPVGIAEKSLLTYRYIIKSYQVFSDARERIGNFFAELEREGVKSIVLYKATVIAEISLLALQNSSLDLVAIVDDTGAGKRFLGYRIQPVEALQVLSFDKLLITSEDPIEKVSGHLEQYGVKRERLCSLK